MKQVDLKVKERDSFGSPECRRMRRQGWIPGVLYGGGNSSVPLLVNEKTLRQALSHERGSVILNLDFEDTKKAQLAMLKELQADPVTGRPLHLDFVEVRMDKPIDSVVPVVLAGQAQGVTKLGGIMDHALRELRIRSLPKDIPASIECNVEAMNVADTLRVSDLKAPDGVEILDDPEALVAAVLAPKIMVAALPVEEAAAPEEAAESEAAEEAPAAEAAEEAAAEGEGGAEE